MIVVAMALTACVVLVLNRAALPACSVARLPSPWPAARPPLIARGQGLNTSLLAAASAALALAMGAGPDTATVLAAITVALRLMREHRRRRSAHDCAVRAVPEACRVLSTHLRAGTLPVDALASAAAASPSPLAHALRSAATAERLGSPAAAAFRASDFGADALWPVALCWQVCAETGAALGSMLDRLGLALSAEQEDRELVDGELAGVRLSAAVMAALPLVGLLLGAALGADPLSFLLGSRGGVLCLMTAASLDAAGVCWIRALARRAAR